MGWNHRVVCRRSKVGDQEYRSLSIHEVYYDEDGKHNACTADSVGVSCDEDEGLDGLRLTLEHMLESLNKPILEYEDFAGGE